ncbi:MAG: DUF222 domain-containing protein [Acidimicrobiales bacterium]
MTSLGCLGTELDQGLASFASGVTGCREQAAGRVESLLGQVEEARRVLVGYEARLVGLADALSAGGGPGAAPEDVLGRGGVSSAEAGRRARRQRSVSDLPEVSAVLGSGRANPECVDRLAGARSRLAGAVEQAAFVARDADLAEWVVSLPPRRFARRVNRLVDGIARDAGRTLTERREREVGLRLWQGADGLYRLHGVFDAESAELLGAAFDREMTALTRNRTTDADAAITDAAVTGPGPADTTADEAGDLAAEAAEAEPDGVGSEPGFDHGRNQARAGRSGLRFDDRLRAEALVEMLARAFRPGSEIAHPLVNVLVDAATVTAGEHETTVAEWGRSGEAISPETRERLHCGGFWQRILFDPATGNPLDVGRSKRVATARQRRALRALYSTCAFGHCDRPFAWCHIHHITPWEEHGPTDFENLVPLCSHHHHLVHEGRWRIRLDARRRLEIRRPDGQWWGHGQPDGPLTRRPRAATPAGPSGNPEGPPDRPGRVPDRATGPPDRPSGVPDRPATAWPPGCQPRPPHQQPSRRHGSAVLANQGRAAGNAGNGSH